MVFPVVVVIQSLSNVSLFVTPWNAACQASLSITNSQSLLKLMSIKLVMPSHHLIFCPLLLLLPSIFLSIRVFSNKSALHIRWPKYWNFSFSISPSNEYSGLISFRIDWFDLLAVQTSLKSLPAPQFESINSLVLRLHYGPGFPVVIYRCESWIIDKADGQSIDACKLWCWRRLLRVLGLQGDQTRQS